jgi:hypothetical protein
VYDFRRAAMKERLYAQKERDWLKFGYTQAFLDAMRDQASGTKSTPRSATIMRGSRAAGLTGGARPKTRVTATRVFCVFDGRAIRPAGQERVAPASK